MAVPETEQDAVEVAADESANDIEEDEEMEEGEDEIEQAEEGEEEIDDEDGESEMTDNHAMSLENEGVSNIVEEKELKLTRKMSSILPPP